MNISKTSFFGAVSIDVKFCRRPPTPPPPFTPLRARVRPIRRFFFAMPKPRPITVVKNFGGRRLADGAVPSSVEDWGRWECDPTVEGRKPTRGFAWGREFPWHFDVEEKAFVVSGEATLTPDDPDAHGAAVRIGPRDMVTFPRGWRGRWEVHSKLVKVYAFFDGKGLRVDEASDDEDEDAETAKEMEKTAKRPAEKEKKTEENPGPASKRAKPSNGEKKR